MFARLPARVLARLPARVLARLLVACSIATAGAAQSPPAAVIDPPQYRWLESERATGFPFGYAQRQVVRHLEIHDGLAGAPRVVAGIALRRAADDTAPAPAFDAVVSMRLSTATQDAATISATFDQNHGADAALALPQRIVSFPASGGGPAGLAPFAFVVPADVPFVFGGGGPLCIELQVASHTNQVPLAFALAAEDANPRTTEFGAPCNGLALATTIETTTARHAITGADPGAIVVLAFGATVLPPIDLAVLGAPGCTWLVDPFAAVAGTADYLSSWELRVPLAGAAPGQIYFTQALSPVVSRNLPPPPHAFRVSGTSLVLTSTSRSASRVWAEDLSAIRGVRQPVFALVVEVR